MLPLRIREFVYTLISKTEARELSWTYSSEQSEADLVAENYSITVRYRFDGDTGIASYFFFYMDTTAREHYRFSATQEEADDFYLLDRLMQQAQASAIKLPF